MFVVDQLIVYKIKYIILISHVNDSDYQAKLCLWIMNQHLRASNHAGELFFRNVLPVINFQYLPAGD